MSVETWRAHFDCRSVEAGMGHKGGAPVRVAVCLLCLPKTYIDSRRLYLTASPLF